MSKIVFMDGTITITPITPPGGALTGYAIQGIDIFGIQTQIKIIDQVIDTFSSTTGTVTNTDTIVQAISKLAGSVPPVYSALHITSSSSTTTNLTALQNTIIFDGSVTGKSVVLPLSSSVVVGQPYQFILMGGLVTSNTVKVMSGDKLNTVTNGTLTIAALLSGTNSVTAVSDGSGWFISP